MIFLNRLSFFFISIVFFTSCDKSNFEEVISDTQQENTDPNEYFPLATGNYWVYEFKTCAMGNCSQPLSKDSLIVTGTVRIKGKDYFRLEEYSTNSTGTNTQISFIRYKNGSVVNSDGSVRLEKPDFDYSYDTTFSQTGILRTYSFYTKEVSDQVATSNASYSACIDFKGAEITLDSNVYPTDNKRFVHHYYSKGIGLIMHYCPFISNQQSAEIHELVRYHLEP